MLLWLLLAGACLLVLGYLLGRRRNLTLMTETARRLEDALGPRDQEYTWIGGLVGFKAGYRGVASYHQMEATLVLLPRHAALFLPVSYLLFRGDRLFLLGRLSGTLRGEFHLLGPDKRLLAKVRRERGLAPEKKGRVWLLASDPPARRIAEDLSPAFERLGAEHLAAVPDRSTVFLLLRNVQQAGHAARFLAALPARLKENGLLDRVGDRGEAFTSRAGDIIVDPRKS